jgi:cell division transport system permease protein
MKLIRIFFRNVKNAFTSIFRNFSLSIASITCTAITLTIVAIAMIVSVNVRKFTKDVADTLTIIVFVEKDATQAEIDTIKSELIAIDEIKADEIEFKSKEKIKEETLEKTKKGSTVYTVMSSWTEDKNPLEPEFIVSVKDIKYIDSTANKIGKIAKVKNVKYSESVVKKMIPLFSFVKKLTIAIIIGLVLVTMFLIWNTIKITIFARRSEIEIMRLVGTSNAVVKLPFVIEGLFLGIIGSIIPIIITIWGYTILYDKMEHHLFSNVLEMVKPMPATLYISGILLIVGALVGMIGSYGTVRKYLKI